MNKPDLKVDTPPRAAPTAASSLRKLSDTLFDFGEPLLSLLGDDAPLPVREQAMQLVITVWNAGAMDLPEWGEPELLRQLEQMLAKPTLASPLRSTLQQMLTRRRELFGFDLRTVGEWALLPQPDGGCVLRCAAHLPAGPTHARPTRIDAGAGATRQPLE